MKITKYETQLNICTDNSNKVENAEELLNAQENKYTEKTKQNKKELEEAKEKNLDLKYEVERLRRENEECINIIYISYKIVNTTILLNKQLTEKYKENALIVDEKHKVFIYFLFFFFIFRI